jgi:hypothetical protein
LFEKNWLLQTFISLYVLETAKGILNHQDEVWQTFTLPCRLQKVYVESLIDCQLHMTMWKVVFKKSILVSRG